MSEEDYWVDDVVCSPRVPDKVLMRFVPEEVYAALAATYKALVLANGVVEAERDELRAWQQEAAKHITEIQRWNDDNCIAIGRLVTMRETAVAERDRAIRQRDHARNLADLLHQAWGDPYHKVVKVPPLGDDDDGWGTPAAVVADNQALLAEEVP